MNIYVKRSYISEKGSTLEVVQGDITRITVDAIVNAANSQLSHGGGVALAIAKAGGEVINQESRAWVKKHGPVQFDAPAYTSAGNLPCQYIIHAVGPIWGEGDEDTKLAAAIRGSLKRAEELNIKSIAFPAISTGIFGFPIDRAASIFMNEFKRYLSAPDEKAVKHIKVVLFDEKTLASFVKAFDAVFTSESKG